MSESKRRSLVKTLTWRITGSTAAVLIAYAVTGSVTVSGTIGILHLAVNTFLYYLHERIWIRINWGRK